MNLHSLARILLHAGCLRDALFASIFIEGSPRLFLTWIGSGVAPCLHLRWFSRAGHLVAPLCSRGHRHRAALRLRSSLQSFQRMVQSVLLEGL